MIEREAAGEDLAGGELARRRPARSDGAATAAPTGRGGDSHRTRHRERRHSDNS